MAEQAQPEVVRNEQTQRFEIADAPEDAHLSYRWSGDRLVLVHTEVADELEGRGVGSALVREALRYAEDERLTVVPECAFVASWLERHPERAAELDIVSP